MKKSTLLATAVFAFVAGRQIYDRNINIDPNGILKHRIVKEATPANRFAAIDYIKVMQNIESQAWVASDLTSKLTNMNLDDTILKELERLAKCDDFVFLESDPYVANKLDSRARNLISLPTNFWNGVTYLQAKAFQVNSEESYYWLSLALKLNKNLNDHSIHSLLISTRLAINNTVEVANYLKTQGINNNKYVNEWGNVLKSYTSDDYMAAIASEFHNFNTSVDTFINLPNFVNNIAINVVCMPNSHIRDSGLGLLNKLDSSSPYFHQTNNFPAFYNIDTDFQEYYTKSKNALLKI